MDNNEITALWDVFLLFETREEVRDFFKDLCTPQEIISLSERWKVCQLLSKGNLSYREIHTLTGASLTTIGRVARFLKNEPYEGYAGVLKKLKNKEKL